MAAVRDAETTRSSRVLALIAALALGCAAGGCAERSADPQAERGRQIYLAQCIACHNMDPAKDGTVGPAAKGASRQLLEAKVLRGTYPPGYTPKRRTAIMPPLPALAADVPSLEAYLR